jgi:WD40 repeat protein
MTFIVPFKENTFINGNLPVEIINIIMNIGDIAQYIIIKDLNAIKIIDYNSHMLIRTIPMLNLLHVSVSNCGNYVVGSDESRICIWNIEDGVLIQEIQAEYIHDVDEENMGYYRHSNHGEPVHTFTVDNNLLIASGHKVKLFNLVNNIWIELDTFEIPNVNSVIVNITANRNTNMFACGDLCGDVYIYDYNTHTLIHNFTTRRGLLRSDHAPSITSIAFNNNILVVSSVGRNNILFNLSTMEGIQVEKPDEPYSGPYFIVENYMFTPDMTKIIGTFNNRTYIWDATTGRLIKKSRFTIFNTCSFSPQNQFIISYNMHSEISVVKYNEL